MSNKIFVDSSIFIESFKGNVNAREILELSIENFDICINAIVFSEVIFRLITIKSGKSALTLKCNKEISLILDKLKDHIDLLLLVEILEENKEVLEIAIYLMKRYNLLTNDALILATCKYYGIDKLASLDKDFENITLQEGIKLISNSQELK